MDDTRNMLIDALDTEDGIPKAAYDLLHKLLGNRSDLHDVFNAVDAVDDVFYLAAEMAFELQQV